MRAARELYVELLTAWADDPVAAELVGPDPAWDAPLRLIGGLHYLVLGGEASWDDPLSEHAEFLREFVATQGVQTNEVQRSWMLVPLLLRVAQRMGAETFDLVELGPSAGLNSSGTATATATRRGSGGARTRCSASRARSAVRFRASCSSSRWRCAGGSGSTARRSTSRPRRALGCCARSSGPARRGGWSASTGRSRRVREDPPQLVAGDYVEELPERARRRSRRDGLTVVFQTASFGYIGDEGRARVRAVLEEAGRERPLAFISTGKPRDPEEHCWGLRLVYWPGGEREFAGHADFHGSWLQWEL